MLKTQHQAIIALEQGTANRAANRLGKQYAAAMHGPIADAVEGVRPTGDDQADLQRLLKTLGPKVIDEMDDTPLAEALAEAMGTAGLIGAASASPRRED